MAAVKLCGEPYPQADVSAFYRMDTGEMLSNESPVAFCILKKGHKGLHFCELPSGVKGLIYNVQWTGNATL